MSDSLALALGIGVAFGWVLERAGLGSARKLAGQFYLTDFVVFKVMFSALVTAMLGAFWLGRVGLLDLAAVHVPETHALPQLVGGLLFGLGFVCAGLCPGTSCVAAASGRGDGAAVMIGMVAGLLGAGLAYPLFAGFYAATSLGVLRWPDVLGLPYGVVVLLVVLIALGGFRLAGHLERA